MRRQQKQSGFALVVLVLLIVIVVLSAGLFVMNKNKRTDNKATEQGVSQNSSASSGVADSSGGTKKADTSITAEKAGFSFAQNTEWGAFVFSDDLSTYNNNGKSLAQSTLLGQYSAYSKVNGNLRVEIFSASDPWPYLQNTTNGLYRYNPASSTWQKQKLDKLTTDTADTSGVQNVATGDFTFFKIVSVSSESKTITYQSKLNDTYMVQVVMNSCVYDTKTREGYTKDPGLCEAPNATTYFSSLETLADTFVRSIKKL